MSPEKNPKRCVGYRFSGGKLCAREEKRAYVLTAWPALEAVQKRPLNSPYERIARWCEFEPAFPVVRSYRPARRVVPPELAWEEASWGEQLDFDQELPEPRRESLPVAEEKLAEQKRRAFSGFRFGIPKEVARLVEPIRGYQWPLLQLLRDHEVAIDSMARNPALTFALALAKRGVREQTHPWLPPVPKLLARKPRDILPFLELPGSEQAARLLALVPASSVYPGMLADLVSVLIDSDATRLATHLPALNLGALQILASSNRGWITARLLEEVSLEPREFYYPFVDRRLIDIYYLADKMRVDLRGGHRFWSVAEVETTWQVLSKVYRDSPEVWDRSNRRPYETFGDVHDYPLKCLLEHSDRRPGSGDLPPPISGTREIRPLTSVRAILKESDAQRNSVAGYVRSAELGLRYVYSVHVPERATLVLARNPYGVWVVGELEAEGQTPVSLDTSRAVRAWLNRGRRWMPEAARALPPRSCWR